MSQAVKKGILEAYRNLLNPLVRILIRHGVSFGEINEVFKSVYVDVAGRNFAVPGRKQSQARIAILTGLTRKEVARLLSLDSSQDAEPKERNFNRVTRVLVGWHTDPEYTGPYGLPRELQFEGSNQPSFSKLVRKYSGDMPARAMLDELRRVKAVEEVDRGWFKVLTRSYIPETLHEDSLQRLGDAIRNYVTTVDFNLRKKQAGAGRFERTVFADNGLRADLLKDFNKIVRVEGQELLEKLDNWLSAQPQPNNSEPGAKKIKTGVGIYHYVEEDELEDNENGHRIGED